jgi:hypothetical protein
MRDDSHRCPKGHLCAAETREALGYCPYCELSQHARVTYVERERQKTSADNRARRQNNNEKGS